MRFFGLTFSEPKLIPFTNSEWHQLVLPRHKTVTVESGSTRWLLEPRQGLVLPAGQGCTFMTRSKTTVRMLYLPTHDPNALRFNWATTRVIAVTPLLVELVERVVSLGALKRSRPTDINLASLIWDEISSAVTLPTALLHPQSTRLVEFLAVLEAKDFRLDAYEAAIYQSGFSRRTIERAFLKETQLTAGEWLRRRRLMFSIELLSSGLAVEEVAYRLRYNGSSAFIAMFKKALGKTPTEFVRQLISS